MGDPRLDWAGPVRGAVVGTGAAQSRDANSQSPPERAGREKGYLVAFSFKKVPAPPFLALIRLVGDECPICDPTNTTDAPPAVTLNIYAHL